MPNKLSTFSKLNEDKSNEVKEEQLENIAYT